MTHIAPSNYVLVGGVMRYVDCDSTGTAVLGIVRHGARGILNRYGLPTPDRRNKQKHAKENLKLSVPNKIQFQDNEKTVGFPVGTTETELNPEEVVTDVNHPNESPWFSFRKPKDLSPWEKLGNAVGLSFPEPKRISLWARFWAMIRFFFTEYVRLGDVGWHRTMRQTAGTILMWSFVFTAVTIFSKALYWVVML